MLHPHLVSSQSVPGPTFFVQRVSDATDADGEIPPTVDRTTTRVVVIELARPPSQSLKFYVQSISDVTRAIGEIPPTVDRTRHF